MGMNVSDGRQGDREYPVQMGYGAWIVKVEANAFAVIMLSLVVIILAFRASRRSVNSQ